MRLWVAVALLALGFLCWMLAGILFGPVQAAAMPSHLVYTVPDKGQRIWREWSIAEGESVTAYACVGTASVTQMRTAYLWGQAISGGGFALLDSHSVVGNEGRPDSFPVPFAGNFYVITRNTVGYSCPSAVVTVLPDIITGIPETPPGDEFVSLRIHDVHGRLVRKLSSSGVYWATWRYKSGATITKRVVVLR